MQRNFILTDVMKTGAHLDYEQFIGSHSFTNQTFDMTGEYYRLHHYNLDSYDRRLAIIDHMIHNNWASENQAYQSDLKNRLEILHQQGFKFIIANPWESIDNIKNQVFCNGDTLKDLDIPYPYHLWTGGVSWFWSYMFHKHQGKKFQFDHSKDKKYNFLYLNKFPRTHRMKLFQILRDKNLIDNSITTFLGLKPPITMPTEYELPLINDRRFDNHARWGNYPRWGLDQDLYEPPYNDTVCSIVSETNDNDYEVFMTEKIWKPIIAGHVFVVHGNHLYLQRLREMGFRTFSKYFDESYDLEKNRNMRVQKITETIRQVKMLNAKDLYMHSQALRRHNQETFFNKEKLSLEVNKTLIGFFEFVDRS